MDYSGSSLEQARRLKKLNERIEEANIPPSILDESLNIATWNIRDFGKTSRSEDGILLIAQILYQFDLIAITEVRDNLSDLKRVLQRLGPYWKFVINDWQPDAAGNRERIAFVYDKRMVEFTGLAAEAAPARTKQQADYFTSKSWWRSPYLASFCAGEFDFILMAMHIRWGTSEGRKEELSGIAEWIKTRWDDSGDRVFDKDLIVLGDFNIPRIGDSYYKALTDDSGLQMPKGLAGVTDTAASSAVRNYDQILHRCDTTVFSDRGGVIDFARDGFLEQELFPGLSYTKATYQLSDHFPLWIQLKTDNDMLRLARAAGGGA